VSGDDLPGVSDLCKPLVGGDDNCCNATGDRAKTRWEPQPRGVGGNNRDFVAQFRVSGSRSLLRVRSSLEKSSQLDSGFAGSAE
jgi:hypothetical protein